MSDKLQVLFPGFSLTRDEPWIAYLPPEKQRYLREQKDTFLKVDAQLDTFRAQFQKYLEDHKELDNLERGQKIREFELRRSGLLKKRDSNVQALKQKILALRDEGLDAMRRAKKKPKLSKPREYIDISDLEVEDDDYLPQTEELKDNHEPEPMETETSPPSSPPPMPSSREAPPDPFLKDLEPRDAEILAGLKSLICKYNCRDRALRAIHGFRSREKTFKALDAITKSIPIFKQHI